MSTTKLAEALRALLQIRNRPISACDPVRLEAEAAPASYEAEPAPADDREERPDFLAFNPAYQKAAERFAELHTEPVTVDHCEFSASRGQWRATIWTEDAIPTGTKLYAAPAAPAPSQEAKPAPAVPNCRVMWVDAVGAYRHTIEACKGPVAYVEVDGRVYYPLTDAAHQSLVAAACGHGKFPPLAAPAAPAPAIAGALFDFLGFLTTSERRWTFSSTDDAGPAVAALEQWASKRSLSLDDADVEGWSAAPAAPAPEPLTDQEVAEAVFDYYQHFHEAHRQEVAEGHFAKDLAIFRIAEKAHGIGIAASKGERA